MCSKQSGRWSGDKSGDSISSHSTRGAAPARLREPLTATKPSTRIIAKMIKRAEAQVWPGNQPSMGSGRPNQLNCLIRLCAQKKDLLKIQCFIERCMGGSAEQAQTKGSQLFYTRFG